ncbi:MAG: F0F1 ATP synthase subunit alpha [Lachnospiraceae bacterium]|nr:F0F1 ATP synthase subunit alpha [Lachnospiraceae bacterium]
MNAQKQTDAAIIRYASTPPTTQQEESIRQILIRRFDNPNMTIDLLKDESISGGFVIQYGNFEYDWSDAGREEQLRSGLIISHDSFLRRHNDEENIISILKERIEDFSLYAQAKEIGTVLEIGDGIAVVKDVGNVEYGEIVIFEDGTRGMVQDIQKKTVGIILFGDQRGIRAGSHVVRMNREAGISVGEDYLGRVVDVLGAPLDGGANIRPVAYYPVEQPAPGIAERQSVHEPMATGILSIDTMFPIGRGQRELIIGDRQTGKTSIALDTILNQKNTGVICIYVAIGQKASTIAQLVNTLKQHDAMRYTTVVAATASDPASLQYIAPYAGTAMAEYFMHRGQHVLIVYDDLSKHAVAYRSLSLLLGRPPGREAYPGDIFYLHSRLLERSAKLSDELGGGSITALPIVETQAGDVSAYIPTNVISITDGQIFLESDLFFEGMRPAVNVGLSVSRVGSSAQTEAIRKASGSIRIDLAQYREMAVFTQFSSDLDDTTKKQLAHGQVLMELLKQRLGRPLSMEDMVITLITANSGLLDDFPKDDIKLIQRRMLNWFHHRQEKICLELRQEKYLPDRLRSEIAEAAKEYLASPDAADEKLENMPY